MASSSVVLDLNWKYQCELLTPLIPTTMYLKSLKGTTSPSNDKHIQHPEFGF